MSEIKHLVMQAVRNEFGQLSDMLPLMIVESEDAAQIYITAFPEEQQVDMRVRPVEYAPLLTEDHLPPREEAIRDFAEGIGRVVAEENARKREPWADEERKEAGEPVPMTLRSEDV